MTEILFERLKKKFASTKEKNTLFHMYEFNERITCYFAYDLFYKLEGPFISSSEMEKIAKEVFLNIPFRFHEKGGEGPYIQFESPVTKTGEFDNYMGHSIVSLEDQYYPSVEIATGYRGYPDLLESQREKYLEFMIKMRDEGVSNAEKMISRV